MNIHFKDINLYEELTKRTIATFKVGSHMYGLDTEKSDNDFLTIYGDVSKSFMWEHHQLQYKQNNIDYNFTTLQNFIRNILTGDSTINFECLYSRHLAATSLSFLDEYKEKFICYNIILSYLGMTKRDFKFLKRDSGDFRKFNDEVYKKASHFLRGFFFSKMLLNNEFSLKLNNEDRQLLLDLKLGNIVFDKAFIDYLYDINDNQLVSLRQSLNTKLEKKQINRFLDVETMKKVDDNVKEINYQLANNFKEDINYGFLFYEALENGISYDN